jgi:cyclohexanone monooxygenase
MSETMLMKDQTETGSAPPKKLDVIVVGAGFAGLYALYKLRGEGYSVRVFEAGDGVGGVWYWNRYPGARCDVESIDYSYSFSEELQQEWIWSERFATQPEIRSYLDHVADRFDLRRDIQLNTFVRSLQFEEARSLWTMETDSGEQVEATYCILATGPLSVPLAPDIAGLQNFQGPIYYTSSWPEREIDFTGQRVGVIGTGSSGIQATPVIAKDADQLYVFQRTPNYSVPAKNGPLPPEKLAEVKARYPELREIARNSGFGNSLTAFAQNDMGALDIGDAEREVEYERFWNLGGAGFLVSFKDLMTDRAANDTAGDFVRRKIKSIVKDPEVARKLTPPADQALGCKRICVDGGYFEAFNRENVSLVDLREEPLDTIVANGLKTRAGTYEFDTLVLATGFDAMTGALLRIDIVGRGGLSLRAKWTDGPISYLGMAISGFPNLFVINGPGAPSVTSNLVLESELQVDWLAGLIGTAKGQDKPMIDIGSEVEQGWSELVADIASKTIFTAGCNSWFVGANIPGKPRLFTAFAGGINAYRDICRDIAEKGYTGFNFAPAQAVGENVI